MLPDMVATKVVAVGLDPDMIFGMKGEDLVDLDPVHVRENFTIVTVTTTHPLQSPRSAILHHSVPPDVLPRVLKITNFSVQPIC